MEGAINRGECFITGPNVYMNSSNRFEVSMVDALDYVEKRPSEFSGVSLAVSFSLAVLKIRPRSFSPSNHFKIGAACSILELHNMFLMELQFKNYNKILTAVFLNGPRLDTLSRLTGVDESSSPPLEEPSGFTDAPRRFLG
ncbi:hypothetical protein ISCGN_026469 [Ixodes scapularis]